MTPEERGASWYDKRTMDGSAWLRGFDAVKSHEINERIVADDQDRGCNNCRCR